MPTRRYAPILVRWRARGPLIFCLEQADQQAALAQICLPADAQLSARYDAQLLGGVVVLEGTAAALDLSDWQEQLYRETPGAAACMHNSGPSPISYGTTGSRGQWRSGYRLGSLNTSSNQRMSICSLF